MTLESSPRRHERFKGGPAESRTFNSNSTKVDIDTCNFFLLNQRKGATGSELSNYPLLSVGEADVRKITHPSGSHVAKIQSSVAELPQSMALTADSGDNPVILVDTMRDLITHAKVSLQHTGFDPSQYASRAKDLRKDSDLIVPANDTLDYPLSLIHI